MQCHSDPDRFHCKSSVYRKLKFDMVVQGTSTQNFCNGLVVIAATFTDVSVSSKIVVQNVGSATRYN